MMHEYLIGATRLAWYPGWAFRAMAWYADVPTVVPVHTGATLYRLIYRTRDASGRAVTASGLVAVPQQLPPRGVVGYFHGTSTLRNKAPSAATLESTLVAGGFAGGRYLLVAPDYIGLGVSTETHPYLHVGATVNAAVDMLRAAREFCRDAAIVWPDELNLVGFSQGAHATAAVQRALEANVEPGLIVRAAAAVDGPYDLAGIAFPFALAGGAPSHSVNLAYIIRGYAALYGHPLESLLNERYASRVFELLDGTHDDDAIAAGLPRQPRDMFEPAFLDAFDAGKETWFVNALAANETFRWAPRAPLRLYYGDGDIDVSPHDTIVTAAAMQQIGGNAAAISVGDYDHIGAVLAAFGRIRAWFDELNP